MFLDGECEKCGGHTYSHSIDEPLKCGRCGAKYPMLKKDIEAIKRIIGKHGTNSETPAEDTAGESGN